MSIGNVQVANYASQISKMNAAQNVSCNSKINFKGNVKQDTFEKTSQALETEKKASTAKKVGVGIASALLTGAGQAVNGEWGKAIGMFGGAIGSGVIGGLLCPPVGVLAALGIGIWSIVDAVKNAKP